MALNNADLVLALGLWGEATAVNIVYSSVRGLISMTLVWSIGHRFGSEERHLSKGMFYARLTEAFLMVAAMVLVLVSPGDCSRAAVSRCSGYRGRIATGRQEY